LIAAVFRKICKKQGFLKVYGASELLKRVFELLERVFELLEWVFELLEWVFELLERVFELLERVFEEPVRAAKEPGVASERFRRATTGSRFTAKEFSASWRGGAGRTLMVARFIIGLRQGS